ncbi:gonad development associated 1 [Phyllostomus discolor]|uniref:Gonad development associated 1 n=1 Tax=Phyllostomus discolor TaxID=89673 RepID=A0A834AP17_9CHIR|nr:gonad development associated 1 [Phyllostomus discolor]
MKSVKSSTWYFIIKSLGEEKKHRLKTATLASIFFFPVSWDTNCTEALFLDVEFSSLSIIFQGYIWAVKISRPAICTNCHSCPHHSGR